MRIYTGTGDDGTTGLYGGDRVSKSSARIKAIGDVDELNAAIGIARAISVEHPLEEMLIKVQNWLFDLGAELACPPGGKFSVEGIHLAHGVALESSMDRQTLELPPLKVFILPGGTLLAAQLHMARCVCRRAERSVLELHSVEPVRDHVRVFMNRLSDWLFVSARTANHLQNVNDIAWQQTEAL